MKKGKLEVKRGEKIFNWDYDSGLHFSPLRERENLDPWYPGFYSIWSPDSLCLKSKVKVELISVPWQLKPWGSQVVQRSRNAQMPTWISGGTGLASAGTPVSNAALRCSSTKYKREKKGKKLCIAKHQFCLFLGWKEQKIFFQLSIC